MIFNYFLIVLIFIIGVVIGSFLNVVIYRTYYDKKMSGRSYCPQCKKIISWYDNIPIFSFLILRGECRSCKKKISWQYLVVELITGILFLIVFLKLYFKFFIALNLSVDFILLIDILRSLLIVSVLVVIFVQDLKWYIVLDRVILPAVAVIFIFDLILGKDILNILLAITVGAGFFLAQFIISNGKWIGGGDIRIGALMGVILGFPQILISLFIAYIGGSIIGLLLIAIGKKEMGSKVPFGTFLTPATFITFLWGDKILDFYLKLSVL